MSHGKVANLRNVNLKARTGVAAATRLPILGVAMVQKMPVVDTAALSVRGPFEEDASRWDAVRSRDRTADGIFFYSVSSTGVYCRPSCPARRARRENVAFHASAKLAESAGFRACKRCHPNDAEWQGRHARAVSAACRHIEMAEREPSLESLAHRAGMSRFHFHRVFKQLTGVTPKAYAAARRATRLRTGLSDQRSVTQAVYEAGYGAIGRFYESSSAVLGMTPSAFRDAGSGAEIRFAVAACSLGHVIVAATSRGICAIRLGDDPTSLVNELQSQFRKAISINGDEHFEAVVAAIVGLIERPGLTVQLPLDVRGTSFQRRVWEALQNIPSGETTSYGELAVKLGAPGGSRAVARACATNPIAVVIPCHRVVRRDGALAGYRWGAERKRELLQREAQPKPVVVR
jgi:AraC family transcriptional regulator, regulatory protein of adaptative response / methylated-DNA-[protein]-cysteine methyltransferase